MEPYIIATQLDKEFILHFEEKSILVTRDITSPDTTALLFGLTDEPCMILLTHATTNKVYLSLLQAQGKCLSDITRGKGTYLLRLAIHFARNILYANMLYLRDDSRFLFKNTFLDLSLYSFLTTGNTWYGRYGFVPTEIKERKEYDIDRQIIEKALTQELSIKLQERLPKKKYVMDAVKELGCVQDFNKIGLDILSQLNIRYPDDPKFVFGSKFYYWAIYL